MPGGPEPRPVEREAYRSQLRVRLFISCWKDNLTMGRKIYRDLKDIGHSPWLTRSRFCLVKLAAPSLDSPCGTAIFLHDTIVGASPVATRTVS